MVDKPRPTGTQALERAFAIVDLVARESRSAGDVARASGLSRPTALRLIAALERHGYLETDAQGNVCLGAKLVGLAAIRNTQVDIPRLIPAALERISRATGETAVASVRQGTDAVVIAVRESSHPIRMTFELGSRSPLHAGSGGKLLLAYASEDVIRTALDRPLMAFTSETVTDPKSILATLAEIRSLGYAWSHGSLVEGAFGIAAPVFDADGCVRFAVGVSGVASRVQGDLADAARDAVVEEAKSLSRALGV